MLDVKGPYERAVHNCNKVLSKGAVFRSVLLIRPLGKKGPLCGNVPCPQKFLEKSPKREALEPFGVMLRTKPSAS